MIRLKYDTFLKNFFVKYATVREVILSNNPFIINYAQYKQLVDQTRANAHTYFNIDRFMGLRVKAEKKHRPENKREEKFAGNRI